MRWTRKREQLGADITVEREAMPARWDWPLAAPLRLRANAVACTWNPTAKHRLPAKPIATADPPQKISLVPYGCTKFRISMFPITERTSKLHHEDTNHE